jgi:hypothetical protein
LYIFNIINRYNYKKGSPYLFLSSTISSEI